MGRSSLLNGQPRDRTNTQDARDASSGYTSPSPLRRASLRDWVEFVGALALFSLFRWIPLKWGLWLGARLGSLAYLLLPKARRVGLKNLSLAFPDLPSRRRRQILRESFRNLGRSLAEAIHMDRLSLDELRERVQISNPDLWRTLLTERKGKGLVVLTAHFGNWELLAHFHGRMGYPVTLIHRPLRNPLLEQWLLQWRAKAGTRSLPRRRAAREAKRVLEQGGILALPGDQNQVFSFGIFVDFFGVPACTTTGPARLAQRVGVPLVPVFLRRDGPGFKHVLEVLPPIPLQATSDREADLRENTQRCSAAIEEMVRRFPDQWVWFHKRWKTRPPGEPKLY